MIDKNILDWLTKCPASDTNFRINLDRANIETIEEALKYPGQTKTAIRFLESKLRRLKK
jgi:hypothetical protein